VTTGPVRLLLPAPLRVLARLDEEVTVTVAGPVTLQAVLDALEARHPVLRGTLRPHGQRRRRPFIRFFAGGQDLSNEPMDAPLPDAVARGVEPLRIVGAMAGGA
jgi:molybdopterin synthase sulfur carrier subunit